MYCRFVGAESRSALPWGWCVLVWAMRGPPPLVRRWRCFCAARVVARGL